MNEITITGQLEVDTEAEVNGSISFWTLFFDRTAVTMTAMIHNLIGNNKLKRMNRVCF